MANGKWVVHYGSLTNDGDVELLEFRTKKERLNFLSDIIIGRNEKVFLLAIESQTGRNVEEESIFIFEKWQYYFSDVQNLNPYFSNPLYEMHLHEYESYEDAYIVALHMREGNPKCYNK